MAFSGMGETEEFEINHRFSHPMIIIPAQAGIHSSKRMDAFLGMRMVDGMTIPDNFFLKTVSGQNCILINRKHRLDSRQFQHLAYTFRNGCQSYSSLPACAGT